MISVRKGFYYHEIFSRGRTKKKPNPFFVVSSHTTINEYVIMGISNICKYTKIDGYTNRKIESKVWDF